ncbi:MAG TPA: type II toxin-antitoxin system VapC family toxin [Burkholderiales bacterium]|nr:type II toxin-antitoxin system VapC family toxin [Burkholderiales bacterium]
MRRIVASAEAVYVDPSALLKLYLHHPESSAMSAWRARTRGPLPITHHGRVEIVNGICLAAFRRDISAPALRDGLASVEEDFAAGRYVQADVLWRSALRRASDLSREHTPDLGCRSLDVLHVACALELGIASFLTFDERQRRLARAVGLKSLLPR